MNNLIYLTFRVFGKLNLKIVRIIYAIKYQSILRFYDIDYKDYTFNGRVKFVLEKGCKVSFGENFICSSGPIYSVDPSFMSSINVKENAILRIGNNSGITGTSIHAHNCVTIGDNVNIGAGTMIYDTNFHSTNVKVRIDREKDLLDVETAPINIGDNVFIGARCLINKGVTIGENSLIGAGSVVVKKIPANELWAGNPAVFIKKI